MCMHDIIGKDCNLAWNPKVKSGSPSSCGEVVKGDGI